MKHRITKEVICFTALVAILASVQGCDTETTATPGGQSPTGNKRARITRISPESLPGTSNQTFSVTTRFWDGTRSSYDFQLMVLNHINNPCTALLINTTIESDSGYSRTVAINVDSLAGTCVSPNSILKIVASVDSAGQTVGVDYAYYQWGMPTGLLTANVTSERFHMPYYTASRADSAATCVVNSFNPVDSNWVKVSVTFEPRRSCPDTVFDARTLDQLSTQITSFSQIYDSSVTVNKIFFGRRQTLDNFLVGRTRWGSGSYENWSIVFKENIANWFTVGNLNHTSIANHIAVHEMLHQLGHIGDSSEYFHYGYFASRCGLWNADGVRFGSEYRAATNRYRICTHHASWLRETLGFIPISSAGTTIHPFSGNPERVFQSDNHPVKMSLAKQTYKKYEPVVAKFEIVNHDSVPLPIFSFEKMASFTNIIIYDESGRSLGGHKGGHASWILAPRTIVQPGDTLVISMSINNWGKDTKYWDEENHTDDYYFSEAGFFEPGNYRARLRFDPQFEFFNLESNDVYFTVTDLTEEDKEILKLYREVFGIARGFEAADMIAYESKLEPIFAMYPDNPFREHIEADRLYSYYWIHIKEDAENGYNSFIHTFPNSYYIFSPRFMTPYLATLKSKKGNFESGVSYAVTEHPESDALQTTLRDDALLSWIKSNVKFLLMDTEK
jgi:hypothetical protein